MFTNRSEAHGRVTDVFWRQLTTSRLAVRSATIICSGATLPPRPYRRF